MSTFYRSRNARIGIIDLNEYHNLNASDLANGKIRMGMDGRIYQSRSPLSMFCSFMNPILILLLKFFLSDTHELLKLAKVASQNSYLSGCVEWLNAALERAIGEGRNIKFIGMIK